MAWGGRAARRGTHGTMCAGAGGARDDGRGVSQAGVPRVGEEGCALTDLKMPVSDLAAFWRSETTAKASLMIARKMFMRMRMTRMAKEPKSSGASTRLDAHSSS